MSWLSSIWVPDISAMTAKNVAAIYPLSPQQRGMLFDTLRLSDGVHIEQKVYVFRGELNPAALEYAWQQLLERHTILRTAFVWKDQDEPLQCVLSKVDFKITKYDWRTLSSSLQTERLRAYLDEDRRHGFQLSKPPLMRLALFQLGDEEHELIWTHHHIVLDGWCRPIVDRELLVLYEAFCNGETASLPPARPYRDYIGWLKRQDLAGAETFWRRVLNGISGPTKLGAETTEINEQPSTGFGELRIELATATADGLKRLARLHHVTVNTVLQGIWALMLSRYSNSRDVVFGTTVSGRPAELDGAEAMLGLFINTLPFRVTVRDASIWTWLGELQAQHLEMRQYEYCSSGQIHQWSQFPARLPLYESILVFENYPAKTAGTRPSILSDAHTYSVGAQTSYALNILVISRDGLELLVVFDRARFVEESLSKLGDHFNTLCVALVADPDQDLETLGQRIPIADAPRIRPVVASAARQADERPRTTSEKRLADIWAEVLGVERVGIEDNFFALNGHSLLATQVMSRIRDSFNAQLPLRALFESPTVSSLAKQIDAAKRAAASNEERLSPVPRDRPLPLSFAQQRLWFLSQLDPESSSYNISNAFRLSGILNATALERALNTVVDRHESLRTIFPTVDEEPVQIVLSDRAAAFETIDLTNVPSAQRDARAMQLMADAAARPFRLSEEPPFRAILTKLSEQDHILVLNVHHIVSDGWSMAILFRELGMFYDAYAVERTASLPQMRIQYADYAVWQRNLLDGERLENLLAYWKTHLAGAPTVLELPLDKPRPSVQGTRAEKVNFVPSRELRGRLESFSRREGVTIFMTMLSVFQVLLASYTGRDDIVVGTDVANRTQVETENLIGFFVNLLPIRTRVSRSATFIELLRQVKEVLLEAYAHQELPFEKLVEELKPDRDLSRNPLVQVLFVMQNTPKSLLEFSGLKVEPMELSSDTSRFDLILFVSETNGELNGIWLYNAELFERATVEEMSTQFHALLGRLVTDPFVRLDSLSISAAQRMPRAQKPMQTTKQVKGPRRKSINLAELSPVKSGLLSEDHSLPLVISPAREDVDLSGWMAANTEFAQTSLLRHGALLFRGFDIPAVSDFERFAQTLCPNLYGDYGDLPREEQGGKVYGSTPYPADETILFHNESSHMHRWPMLIWFYCVKPAASGGETPLVDCRKIYQALDLDLRRKFAALGLMYVRNFTPSLDVSWQDFFHTTERSVVEDYCKRAAIDFEWKTDGGLRTRQICPAIVEHPQTGEAVFFNQLQLHHVACLSPAVRESLLSMMREEDLPRNVYYGDGTRIEDGVIDELLTLYRRLAVSFPWREHDIIMLNNMLVAHARTPYVGERKIVVALGNLVSKEQVDQRERAH